jgi:hypothetical protein
MGRPKHAAAPINAIVHDEEVVVARKLVFVYAVQSSLLWCATWAITVWDKACILNEISESSEGEPPTYPYMCNRMTPEHQHCSDHNIFVQEMKTKMSHQKTYRFLALLTFRSINRVVVFRNVQVQKVLIWKVLQALGTPVRVRLLIVHIVGIE